MLQNSASAGRLTSLLRDYAELTKARITTLIVLTAWCGYFFGAHKTGVSSWSVGLIHALLGVTLVSSGTAALNEVIESHVDARMRRTANRPLPSGRMSRGQAAFVGLAFTLGGSLYLAFFANALTGLLVFLTAVVYLAAYTPLKQVSPICTFVGAFPGAMPVVLGWTAIRARIEVETLIFFRSHGSTAKTTRGATSVCCRWCSPMGNRPCCGFLRTPRF